MVYLFGGEVLGYGRGRLEVVYHLAALHERLHRHGLHEVVRLLAHEAFLYQSVHHALCEDSAVGESDIMEHVLGIDHEVVEYALKARQHIVK